MPLAGGALAALLVETLYWKLSQRKKVLFISLAETLILQQADRFTLSNMQLPI